MSARLLRLSLGLVLMMLVLRLGPGLHGQAPMKQAAPPGGLPGAGEGGEEDYRRFFKKPSNLPEYWTALQFEIDVGKFELAARYLRGLLDYKPTDADLAKLADQVGIAAFLRLRNIPIWSDNPAVNKQAKKDVEDLLQRATAALKKVRGDPERIKTFIKNLNATPEERSYALRELYKSGAAVVPYLIDELKAADPGERVRLLDALRQLGPDTVEPLIAVLDSDDPRLQIDVLRLFIKRYAPQVVPHLWYLSGSSRQAEDVRRAATEALAFFLSVKPGLLPPAKVELTRLAQRYYLHEVKFPDPAAATIWRWDNGRVVEGWPGTPTVPADRAEEYWVRYYAGRALVIDPQYQPAQVVLLSLMLERAQLGAGLDQMLDRASPAVHGVLASVSPELVLAVLERALQEKRVPVILGAVRDLGERDEVLAYRAQGRGRPPLVQALYYPDRRVQMAAAEALQRIPGSSAAQATTRVVEVLRRALAAEPTPREPAKVIVGYFNPDVLQAVAAAVSNAGLDPIQVTTGREMLQRLNQASDVALLLFDQALPMPGLDSLLGQLHADVNSRQLPILLSSSPEREEAVRRFTARYPNVTVIPAALALDVKYLQPLFREKLGNPASPALTPAELKAYAERAIRHLARLSRGEPAGYDVVPAGPTVLAALRTPTNLTPEGQIAAMEVAGRLKDNEAQIVLFNVLTDPKRPLAVRVTAANQLVHHLQQFGPLLTRDQLRTLDALYAQPNLDPPLKASLAVVLGTLRPDARLTGERLLQFQPPSPAPPKPDK
jgi:CheY-like chemotaxis protein